MDILRKNLVLRNPYAWDDEIAWFLLHSRGKSFKKSILKLPLAAVVYSLWCESNMRIFQQKALNPPSLGSKISNAIRDSVLTWRNIKPNQGNRLVWHLGVSPQILEPVPV